VSVTRATELPTGTVTLLFTDVEDSTGLVRELGGDYARVIAEHRRLVRDVVEERGGYEVDCRGDEFFLAFVRPEDAVRAATEIQRRHESRTCLAEHLLRRCRASCGLPDRAKQRALPPRSG
jgi:class 3 adenylate cyclase